MKNILIIEDEFPIAMDIENRLKKFNYNVVGIGSSFSDALMMTATNNPDLILMDINIDGDKNGIEAAEILGKMCNVPIVFLTALSDEKTLKLALAQNPAGYLLKPFNDLQIKTTIEIGLKQRAKLLAQQAELEKYKKAIVDQVSKEKKIVFIKDKYKIVKIELNSIICLQAMDNYTQIINNKAERIIVHLFLKDVLQNFENDSFVRIHRSHAVNINHIDYVEGNRLFIQQKEYPIGATYKQNLLDKMG